MAVTALTWGDQIPTNQMFNAVRSLLLKYNHPPPFASYFSLLVVIYWCWGFFSFYSNRSILSLFFSCSVSLMLGVLSRCVSLHVKMQNISCKCSKNVCENHHQPHPAINSFLKGLFFIFVLVFPNVPHESA